jgi:hypothetical protein
MKKWTINLKKKKIEISVGRWDPKLGNYDLKRVDWEDEYDVKPPRHCWFCQKYEWGETECYIELFRFYIQINILDANSTKLQRRREK